MINKKQNTRIAITGITNQDIGKLINNFDNSPYTGYKSKQVHSEPTEAYFLLVKPITKLVKIDRCV